MVRLLLACTVISVTGTAVALVAVPFAVLAIGGSAADVGYVAAAVMVPALLFPLGGVVADRLPRHQAMMAGSLHSRGQAHAAAATRQPGPGRHAHAVARRTARAGRRREPALPRSACVYFASWSSLWKLRPEWSKCEGPTTMEAIPLRDSVPILISLPRVLVAVVMGITPFQTAT